MRSKGFLIFAVVCVALVQTDSARAWGPQGHRVIGQAALLMLNEKAKKSVLDILGDDRPETVLKACYWPDTVRKSSEWEWSAPLHYVNLPRHASDYRRERDCPDGLCVTQGIIDYAGKLAGTGLDEKRRWQAFAWLCHLIGDVHQPLHAAYQDDRGGNRFEVEYQGRPWNLHEFWDGVLVNERLGHETALVNGLVTAGVDMDSGSWSPGDAVKWTEESHAIAGRSCYPESRLIDSDFADRSWFLIKEQWQKAAMRLALTLNSVLGDSAVIE